MANLSNVIKISRENYDILSTQGSIVIDGITYTYDQNALYLVDNGYTEATNAQFLYDLNDEVYVSSITAAQFDILYNSDFITFKDIDDVDYFYFKCYNDESVDYLKFYSVVGTNIAVVSISYSSNSYRVSWKWPSYVRYDINNQALSSTEKSNARTNIGAGTSTVSGTYSGTNWTTITIDGVTKNIPSGGGGSGSGSGFSTTLLDSGTPVAQPGAGATTNITASMYAPYDWLIVDVVIGTGYHATQLVSTSWSLDSVPVGIYGPSNSVVVIYQDTTYLKFDNSGTSLYEYYIYGVNK